MALKLQFTPPVLRPSSPVMVERPTLVCIDNIEEPESTWLNPEEFLMHCEETDQMDMYQDL